MLKIKTKQDSKDTKDKIIELFYEQHKRTTDIARELKIVDSYVTKIIQKDSRYIEEKELRGIEGKERTKAKKREHIRNKRAKEKQEYQAMLIQINKDNEILSTKKKEDDLQFAKWNRSAFKYDKNSSDLILKNEINAGYAIAKRVSDVINPNMIKSNKIYV